MATPILKVGSTGKNVERLQRELDVVADGELGPVTWRAWRERFVELGGWGFSGTTARARRRFDLVTNPKSQTAREAKRAKKVRANTPLRERAYRQALALVGTMESGGNNRGPGVERIIRGGGGTAGQSWCGWFLAYVFRLAGSRSVVWQWGAVRLWVPLSGISRTTAPLRGDVVRFTFDHIGMFVRFVRKVDGHWVTCTRAQATHIETIEGNTGATGAVSDGNGHDGVYEKIREKGLIRDFLKVTR